MSAVKDAALTYASNGWPVLPLHSIVDGKCTCGETEKHSEGKHPRTDFAPNGVHSATLDLEAIAAWPEEEINVGVALGVVADDLMVADIDDTKIAEALGNPQLALQDKVGVSVTGRGVHLWFKTNGATLTHQLKTLDGKSIGEMRGDIAYVAAPPSNHINGRQYRWAGDRARIPRIENSLEFVAQILETIGVSIISSRDELLPLVALPSFAVMPQDVPEQLLTASTELGRVQQMISGSVIHSGERSDDLYGVGYQVYMESLVHGVNIELEALAGIVKKVDIACHHTYTDRRDGDTEYVRIATKLVNDREAMTTKAQKKHDNTTQLTPGTLVEPDQLYIWDAGKGTLVLKRGQQYPQVANFFPRIVRDIEIDTGDGDFTRARQLRFAISDNDFQDFTLTAEQYSSIGRLNEALTNTLPARYLIYPRMGDHVMAAAHLLGGEWPTTREFSSSGWIATGSDRVYLLPGAVGGIGVKGLEPDIRINADMLPEGEPIASDALSHYGERVRPPVNEIELAQAWEAFEALLTCGPPEITMSIVLQVLAGPLSSAGARDTPPLMHVLGRTGTLKTSLCHAALSLFGTFTRRTAPPANWGSTSNSLQTVLHATKDLTLLVDDYKTSVVRRVGHTQLVQQYADGSVRQRQSLNQRLQKVQTPRGLILSNGEDMWEREASAEARTITVHIKHGDVTKQTIRVPQRHVSDGTMQLFGGAYLRWLANNPLIFENEEITALCEVWSEKLDEATLGDTLHLRLLASVATLGSVSDILLRFVEAIFPEKRELVQTWTTAAIQSLTQGARERGVTVEEAAPFRQLSRAIVEAMAARTACFWPASGVSEYAQRIPDVANAEIIGYWFEADDPKQRTVLLTSSTTYAWMQKAVRSQGEVIGFSWTAARGEAVDSYGAKPRQRVRVKTEANGADARQLSGMELLLSEFERAGGEG